jgi:general secretion pathway protein K
MTTRRGFALLAALWVITALTVLGGTAVAVARTGSATTRNRMLLARAAWARETCVEILLARFADDPSIGGLETIDLGRSGWCRATLADPAAQLNVNLADRSALVRVLSAVSHRQPAVVDSLVDALLDWRDPDTLPRPNGLETPENRNGPLAAVTELRYVRGFDDTLVARLARVLTTRGTGTINLNAASTAVLGTVPGITDEAVELIVRRRQAGQPVRNAEELTGLLSAAGRATLYASYPEFVRTATFARAQLAAVVEGGVHGTPLVARVTLTTMPVAGRLAVIRRETE